MKIYSLEHDGFDFHAVCGLYLTKELAIRDLVFIVVKEVQLNERLAKIRDEDRDNDLEYRWCETDEHEWTEQHRWKSFETGKWGEWMGSDRYHIVEIDTIELSLLEKMNAIEEFLVRTPMYCGNNPEHLLIPNYDFGGNINLACGIEECHFRIQEWLSPTLGEIYASYLSNRPSTS